jgi:glyoxylase-like metal-dependent hydrolase (beta-lactamase superfamily II)
LDHNLEDEGEGTMLYQWLILQDGSLPLKPDGRRSEEEHACTSTLLWPVGTGINRLNSILIDPCFSAAGWESAKRRMGERGISWDSIGFYFETHEHYDHMLSVPAGESLTQTGGSESGNQPNWIRLTKERLCSFPGISLVSCPGHSPDLLAVRCETADGEVWIVGDAILDRSWLLDWMFYWPNRYDASDVVETWRSVSQILETASVVIPGHGPPIFLDSELLRGLLERFPRAFQSQRCPEVAAALRKRLQQMS